MIDQFTALLLLLLLAHWIGDFVLQTEHMALHKSKQVNVLLTHVFVYSIPLLVWKMGVITFASPHTLFWWFYPVNVAAHFVIDYYTSRWTAQLRAVGNQHGFFTVIGLDQLLHAATLIITLRYLMFS